MTEVILLEGKIEFSAIKQDHFKKKSIIITFDYHAHKSLSDANIEHKIVEEYFDENDKSMVDDISLKLATSWYKNEKISKYLEYEKLNLGSVLELELTSYFLIHIKRIIGLKKILEKENPEIIKSHGLKNYVTEFCKNKTIQTEFFDENKTVNLFFDEFQIPINLLFIKKNLKISRKNYFILKKCTDNICNLIFNIKPNKNLLKNNKSILLLDFNTKIYDDFLKSFPDSDTNIIILNQRKPAIWDLKSLNTIRNSNCKVLAINELENNKTKAKKNEDLEILEKNLDLLWKSENHLNEIFSVEGFSFWNIIKNNFQKIITERFNESVKRMILVKELFKITKIKGVLDWAHTGTEEKEIIHFANIKNIPIFCLQHGIMTLNPSFEKYHPLMPVLPFNNEKMLVWGTIMKSYLLNHKVKEENIKIIGSPRHDRFFKRRANVKNNNTILIASNLFFHTNFNGNDSRAYERFEWYLKKILELIKKNYDKKPIIKLHATEFFDITSIAKKIDPDILIYQHEDVMELLESCDTLISMNYSTIILDSLILNKPTMVLLPEKQNYENEEVIKQNAVISVSNIDELELKLNKILTDNEIRNNLILNGQNFIDKYFSYQEKSSNELSKFLLNN